MKPEQVIEFIIDLVTYYLDELNSVPKNDFVHGQMTAYVDVLELIQDYQDKVNDKLKYTIQDKYPI